MNPGHWNVFGSGFRLNRAGLSAKDAKDAKNSRSAIWLFELMLDCLAFDHPSPSLLRQMVGRGQSIGAQVESALF
jgi:hypothetical protein